jgi:EpsI family protein
MLSILNSRNLIVFTVIAVAQGAAGYYLNARQEYVPPAKPLVSLAQNLDGWTMAKEWPMEPEVQAVLKADDTLSRHYVRPGNPEGVGLFIAFFKSQRAGVAPHSPKNCLPGNGWVKEVSTTIPIEIPGRAEPVESNNYVIQKGDNKSVVLYWYQSHGRTVADEFKAKFYVMADAMRLNRTDTALVRVTVPVTPAGVQAAEKSAIEFVRTTFGPLSEILPN